jgi:hypothetical protein
MKQNAESYGETGDRMQDFLHYTAESGISDCGFRIVDSGFGSLSLRVIAKSAATWQSRRCNLEL